MRVTSDMGGARIIVVMSAIMTDDDRAVLLSALASHRLTRFLATGKMFLRT